MVRVHTRVKGPGHHPGRVSGVKMRPIDKRCVAVFPSYDVFARDKSTYPKETQAKPERAMTLEVPPYLYNYTDWRRATSSIS